MFPDFVVLTVAIFVSLDVAVTEVSEASAGVTVAVKLPEEDV